MSDDDEVQNSDIELQMACYSKWSVSVRPCISLVSGFHQSSAAKEQNNAQKVPNNAFLMLFLKKGI